MKPPIDLIKASMGAPVTAPYQVAERVVHEQATQPAELPAEPPPVATLSEFLWESILENVASGLPFANACRLEGVDPSVVTRMIRTRPDLASQIAQAKNGLLKRMVGVIVAAADEGDYRAAAIMVNRLDPQKDKRFLQQKKPQTLDVSQVKAIQTLSLEDLRGRTT